MIYSKIYVPIYKFYEHSYPTYILYIFYMLSNINYFARTKFENMTTIVQNYEHKIAHVNGSHKDVKTLQNIVHETLWNLAVVYNSHGNTSN